MKPIGPIHTGGQERIVSFIKNLGLAEEDIGKILWENAVRLF